MTPLPPFLYLIGFILWIASNVGPILADKEYRKRHEGRPLFASQWSVLHLWWGGQATFFVLILMTSFLMIGVLLFAKPLHLSMEHLMDAIGKSEFTDPKVLLFFFLPATILQNVAFFLVPAVIITAFYKQSLKSIGLPKVPPQRAVVAGILLGFGFLLIAGLGGTLLEKLAEHFKYLPAVAQMLGYEKTNAVAQMADTLPKAGWAGLVMGLLTVAVAAPIGEEMLFRGFMMNALSRRFGNRWGLVLSALLFAAPHTYSLLGLTVIFFMGLVLGHVYRTSGSLWTTIFIHAINNGVQILMAFFMITGSK